MRIKDKRSGETFEIDRRKARIRHTQKRVHAWATALDPLMKQRGVNYRLVMVRLSYRPGEEWKPNQIRDFMLKLRSELGENLKAYAWVAELQKREAVHYHGLLLVKRGTRIPFFDEAGWWPYGFTRIETAVKTIFYICSYTSKEHYQKFGKFPKGLRMFSVWIGEGVVSDLTRWKFRLSAFPAWLSSKIGIIPESLKVERRIGGGWLVNGLDYYSPYELLELDTRARACFPGAVPSPAQV